MILVRRRLSQMLNLDLEDFQHFHKHISRKQDDERAAPRVEMFVVNVAAASPPPPPDSPPRWDFISPWISGGEARPHESCLK